LITEEEMKNRNERDIPFKEMMIHIKKAVKVMASGKIKRSTIQSGAFCHELYPSEPIPLPHGIGRELQGRGYKEEDHTGEGGAEGRRTSSSTSTVPTEYITI
jgi:hypothetical protein